MKKFKFLTIVFVFVAFSCSKESNDSTNDDEVIGFVGLKDIANVKGKFIGNLMRDGFFNNHQIYGGSTDYLLKTEYNALVTGNKLKMSNILRNRPQDPFNITIYDLNTYNIDRFVDYANQNSMKKRGHVLIWYNQIPSWLEQESPNWTSEQIYRFSESYIKALVGYTKGKIDEWDVLNEAILNNGYRTGTWYDVVNSQSNDNGDIGYEFFFHSLFKWAREADENVKLFYNDFGAENFGSAKNNTLIDLVLSMKNTHSTPIDGVGLQAHFKINQLSNSFISGMGETIYFFGLHNLTVNLTELDIRICNGDSQTIDDQGEFYKKIVETAFSYDNCNTILIWGPSDNDSWINSHYPGCGQATPHDENFLKKPAYYGIKQALEEL